MPERLRQGGLGRKSEAEITKTPSVSRFFLKRVRGDDEEATRGDEQEGGDDRMPSGQHTEGESERAQSGQRLQGETQEVGHDQGQSGQMPPGESLEGGSDVGDLMEGHTESRDVGLEACPVTAQSRTTARPLYSHCSYSQLLAHCTLPLACCALPYLL